MEGVGENEQKLNWKGSPFHHLLLLLFASLCIQASANIVRKVRTRGAPLLAI